MMNFIENSETCKQQAIALYFGEKNPDICHNCYVCKNDSNNLNESVSIKNWSIKF